MKTNKHRGSTFESFLKEENLLVETEAAVIKNVVAHALAQAMEKAHMTKTAMAQKLGTSRAALERLLDPENTSVTLTTLLKAAHASGKKLRVSFVSSKAA